MNGEVKEMYETLTEACRAWVGEMHHIPMSVVEKLIRFNESDIVEVTPPSMYDIVEVYNDEVKGLGEIVDTNWNGEEDLYMVKMDKDPNNPQFIYRNDLEVVRESGLPMWGTMFAFTDTCDNDWLENNLQAVADCGFRIYESEDYGYIFGIDGAGYDFYEAHWIPLYKARGFHWHKTDDTKKEIA